MGIVSKLKDFDSFVSSQSHSDDMQTSTTSSIGVERTSGASAFEDISDIQE